MYNFYSWCCSAQALSGSQVHAAVLTGDRHSVPVALLVSALVGFRVGCFFIFCQQSITRLPGLLPRVNS